MARFGGDDEEDAPWLAAAEPDGRETYVSQRRFKLIAILLGALLLVVIALIYAVIARPHDGGGDVAFGGDVPLIRAPDGPFRTRPADAGGMRVEGIDQTTYQAAGGVDPQGELALDQIPEEPMARPVATPKPQPAPPQQVSPQSAQPQQHLPRMVEEEPLPPPPTRVQPQVVVPPAPKTPPVPATPTPKKAELPEVKAPKPADKPKVVETPKKAETKPTGLSDLAGDIDKAAAKTPKKKPAADDDAPIVTSGGSGPAALQLGAFSSSAKADTAWKNFGRYSYLSGLTKSVTKVEREGGETVYRLKATGVESREKAANLCARLKIAGEQCVVSQ